MAYETELALSAVRAGEGIQFPPSSGSLRLRACLTVTAVPLPVDRDSRCLTQREASRAGRGSRSTMHREIQDLEELILLTLFYLFPPRKLPVVFYHNPIFFLKAIDSQSLCLSVFVNLPL